MRKQIAAANWKMNLTVDKAEALLQNILTPTLTLNEDHLAVFAVPSPYLQLAQKAVAGKDNIFIAAQNCYSKKSGAYTGEVSAPMLKSMAIPYVIVGHSERRQYFGEDGKLLATKVDKALANGITPIFCCGEPLEIREKGTHEQLVKKQVEGKNGHILGAVTMSLQRQ